MFTAIYKSLVGYIDRIENRMNAQHWVDYGWREFVKRTTRIDQYVLNFIRCVTPEYFLASQKDEIIVTVESRF